MDHVWAIAFAVLGFLSMLGFMVTLIRDGISKDKKIVELEYEKEKDDAKIEASKDSIDTIIKRIVSRIRK